MAVKKQTKSKVSKKATKYELQSPLTGEIIDTYPREDEKKVLKRLLEQKPASNSFALTSLKFRIDLMKKVRKEFISQTEILVKYAHLETGKPLAEVYGGEIVANIELFDFYIKHAKTILTAEAIPINPINYPGKKGKIFHRPLGVVAVISSWNYPIALALRAIIPAVIAGNAVAFKPSDQSTKTGEIIGEIFQKYLPENVMRLYFGGREAILALANNCDKVNFIGSVDAGKAIAATCGAKLTACSTELSGKDAAIVLNDANVERTLNGIIWGAFTNSGQNCASIERLFIEKEIAHDFIPALVNKVRKLRLKDDIGPLRNAKQLQQVKSQLSTAQKSKAIDILCGGSEVKDTLFFEPTVMLVKKYNVKLMHDETFGPTLPIYVVDNLEQAIDLANDCDFGLTCSIWTKDLVRAQSVAHRLEAGVVTINNSVFTGALAAAPWGGVKDTGHGITNSKYGLLEMTRPMLVLTDKSTSAKEPWWFPYHSEIIDLMKTVVKTASGNIFAFVKLPFLLAKVKKTNL